MALAIEKAREGIKAGQSPFGACIVRARKVVTCVHNTVWKNIDITAYAESYAIRKACQRLDTVDISDCVIYTTTEPCPMCIGAIHWARLERIICGAEIVVAVRAGFNELTISNSDMNRLGGSAVKIEGGLLSERCIKLFKEWSRLGNKAY